MPILMISLPAAWTLGGEANIPNAGAATAAAEVFKKPRREGEVAKFEQSGVAMGVSFFRSAS
jgi:hypothetical protein